MRGPTVGHTRNVIKELSQLTLSRAYCRVEVSTLLRFAGAVPIMTGKTITTELDTGSVTRHLRTAIQELSLSQNGGCTREASARTERALHIIGDRVPDHLAAAGVLRHSTDRPR